MGIHSAVSGLVLLRMLAHSGIRVVLCCVTDNQAGPRLIYNDPIVLRSSAGEKYRTVNMRFNLQILILDS